MSQDGIDENRAGFLEGAPGDTKKSTGKTPPLADTQPPAYYDFNAQHIDLPRNMPLDPNGNPKGFQTTGEIKYNLLKRFAIIIIRITIAILFILLFIRGSSCEYPGTIITCT